MLRIGDYIQIKDAEFWMDGIVVEEQDPEYDEIIGRIKAVGCSYAPSIGIVMDVYATDSIQIINPVLENE